MGRRRELADVANGIAGAFVSRNHDLDGYWALGRLYEQARELRTREMRFDLLRGTSTPPSGIAERVAGQQREKLLSLLQRKGLALACLRSAEVSVEFDVKSDNPPPQQTYGDPFITVVTLVDDRGREYSASRAGWCAPHDPQRERQRARGAD